METFDSTQLLKEMPAFANLSEDTLSALAALVIPRAYASGHHLVLQGAWSNYAFLIVQGEVRVYRVSVEGREQVLARLGPGDVFNLVSFFDPQGYSLSNAVAVSSVIALALPREGFLRTVRTHGDLAFALLQGLAERLRHMTDLVENLALYSVRQRLARFLLDHAPEPGNWSKSGQVWTQSEIAAHLGTVREMVSRGLKSLEAMGAVRLERGRIVLLSREELEAAARR